ncbi:MAG: hypothetical protein D6834_02735 [Aquificota bacterium]|nr:MAG: hypothetical protein D6834_02735 [Aquificota bacterium]
MGIKATRNQINYLIESIMWFSIEELKQLPLPSELIRYRQGDLSKKEIEKIISEYPIQKAHNIICVINNHIKRG